MPRDPERIDPVVEALRRAWQRDPDQRFGQLITNIVREAGGGDPWNREDDEWLEILNNIADKGFTYGFSTTVLGEHPENN